MTKNRELAESSLSPIMAIVFQRAKSTTAGARYRSILYNQTLEAIPCKHEFLSTLTKYFLDSQKKLEFEI